MGSDFSGEEDMSGVSVACVLLMTSGRNSTADVDGRSASGAFPVSPASLRFQVENCVGSNP
jgi:hypothetical protein